MLAKMTRRGNNAPQQGKKAYDNRRGKNNSQPNGQQQFSRGPLVSAFLNQPALTLKEKLDAPLSATYAGKEKYDKKAFKSNIRDGGGRQFSSPWYQNDRVDNSQELNSYGMESNSVYSSGSSRGRGRGRGGDRGSSGRGRGNSDSRGRGRGYQGRNDDGRGRNDTRNDTSDNGSSATPPVGNEIEKEFEENVRDLTATGASRLARFSNNNAEQSSYDEVHLRLNLQHTILITDAQCS